MKQEIVSYLTRNQAKILYHFEEKDREYYKSVMKEQHIKGKDLAKIFGWSPSYITKVLKGEKPITDFNLEKLNLALHIRELKK